jgi:hypothetical protein
MAKVIYRHTNLAKGNIPTGTLDEMTVKNVIFKTNFNF